MEEKNAEQKMWNERMQIYPKFKTLIGRFLSKMAHHFFVKFITILVVSVLILT